MIGQIKVWLLIIGFVYLSINKNKNKGYESYRIKGNYQQRVKQIKS